MLYAGRVLRLSTAPARAKGTPSAMAGCLLAIGVGGTLGLAFENADLPRAGPDGYCTKFYGKVVGSVSNAQT